MADSLKEANKMPLLALVAANLVVFYSVVEADALAIGNWQSVLNDLTKAIPAGIGLILVGILNAQLSPEAKARIVFLRWNDPLPGSRAFTEHAQADQRVDILGLTAQFGELPTTPRDQNVLWYRIYKSVDSEPAVIQSLREYLLTRDFACLALFVGCVLGIAGGFQILSNQMATLYVGLLLLQFELARRAARNHGTQLVKNVLALKNNNLKGSNG